MSGGGLQSGDDAVIVVIGVRRDLGEPDHLFGEDGLAVDDGGHLAVGAAGVEADPAALQMAAHGLGDVHALGHLVGEDDFKGMLEDVGEVIPVEFPGAALAVDALQIAADVLVIDIDPEAALHPQLRFHQTVDVIPVSLRHLRGSVDKGMGGCHLAVRPLHRDGDGLGGGFQKGLVEPQDRGKLRVQDGNVFDLHRDAVSLHKARSSNTNILMMPVPLPGPPGKWLFHVDFEDAFGHRGRGA